VTIHIVLHITDVVPKSLFLSFAICLWIVLNPVYPACTNWYDTRGKEILSLLHLPTHAGEDVWLSGIVGEYLA
jgi:hypothetical protein